MAGALFGAIELMAERRESAGGAFGRPFPIFDATRKRCERREKVCELPFATERAVALQPTNTHCTCSAQAQLRSAHTHQPATTLTHAHASSSASAATTPTQPAALVTGRSGRPRTAIRFVTKPFSFYRRLSATAHSPAARIASGWPPRICSAPHGRGHGRARCCCCSVSAFRPCAVTVSRAATAQRSARRIGERAAAAPIAKRRSATTNDADRRQRHCHRHAAAVAVCCSSACLFLRRCAQSLRRARRRARPFRWPPCRSLLPPRCCCRPLPSPCRCAMRARRRASTRGRT